MKKKWTKIISSKLGLGSLTEQQNLIMFKTNLESCPLNIENIRTRENSIGIEKHVKFEIGNAS